MSEVEMRAAAAANFPVRRAAHAFQRLIELLAGLLPLVAIAYLQVFMRPDLRFQNAPLHEAAIVMAVLFGGFLSFVAWHCYQHSREAFLRWITLGFMGFTLIYVMHGVFTRHADHALGLFLLYGPVARLVMAACLLAGTLAHGLSHDQVRVRGSYWAVWAVVFAIIDILVGFLGTTALGSESAFRTILEIAALALYLGSLVVLTAGRKVKTSLTALFRLALLSFAWSSLSFVLGEPWSHQWWLAHCIFAAGFLVLGYGVLKAYLSTGSLELMFSEEQLLAELETVNARLIESNAALLRKKEMAETASHQFESLFALAPDAVLLIRKDGRILKANARAAGLFGYREADLTGKQVEELMSAGQQPASLDLETNLRALVPGQLMNGLRADGESFPAEISYSPISFDNQPCTMAIVRDVTQRKAAQEALRESEELLRSTIEFAPIGMAIVGLDGTLLRVNRALCRILGYGEEELLSMNFWKLTYLEDQPTETACTTQMLEGRRQMCQMNKRCQRKDGPLVWISFTGSLIRDQEGQPRYFIAQMEDITGRIQRDEHTAELMEQLRNAQTFAARIIAESTQGIITYHASGRCLQANEAAAKMLGGTVEELLTQNFRLAPSWKESGAYNAATLALEGGAPVHLEMNFATPFGKQAWLDCDFVPFISGSEHHLLVILTDVSTYRMAEQSLREAKLLADRASQAKSDFLANMSHEIRTPMNAIMGLAYLLRCGSLSEEQRDYVNKIDMASRSLLAIINDILDFSKIESGHLELNRASFSLGTVLDELATIMSASAGTKPLELIVGTRPDVPAHFVGDALRLEQVLINLAGNAIKFTNQGEVAVEVSLVSQEADRATLRFSVRDTGIGIAPDKVDHIFEAFTQADASITRLHGGTGLGLSISKRLVELMGGEIGVISQPGSGSEFWFTVNLELDRARPQLTSTMPVLEVLIADDHEHARHQLANTAQSLGWHTQTAASGNEALALAKDRLLKGRRGHDVVILDLHMPGLDGLAASRALRAEPGLQDSLLMIMTTTALRDEIQHSPDATQVDAILTKPVTASGLQNVISSALARRGLEGALQPLQVALPAQQRLEGLRILVVDDSDINQVVACHILELDGAIVDVARDGLEAVERLRQYPDAFDVVLMDVQMPVLDGLSATQRIRQELGLTKLPVIALTAGVTEMQRSQALAAGMNEFITKPFEAHLMIGAIQRASRHLHTVPRRPQPVGKPARARTTSSTGLPEIAGINHAQAVARLGNDRRLFLSLLKQLVDESAHATLQARDRLTEGDLRGAARPIHRLRGMAGNLAAMRIADLAASLEGVLAGDEPGQDAHGLLVRLEQAVTDLRTAALPLLPDAELQTAVPAERPLDQKGLEQLLADLSANNMSALDRFPELSGGLIAHFGAGPVQELADAIEQLHFPQAAALLEKLMATEPAAETTPD